MKVRTVLAAALAVMAFAGTSFAEDLSIVTDESALFGDDPASIIESVETSTAGSALSTFLKNETVRIGGSFTGSVGANWTMRDPWSAPALDAYALDSVASGTLFFDARPEEDFRVYGKMKAAYPFATSADSDGRKNAVDVPNLQVFELFADWNWNDALFLRFGKHTIKWGVGYFFSPADVLNLSAIDPEDPTAQREGPVSLRLHYSVPGTQTNIWAYAIMPSKAAERDKPEYIASAAKLEFLLARSWEIGLGGYYKYDSAPRAVLTATGSIWKLNVFGEAVASWGSDKTFVTTVSATQPDFVITTDYDSGVFFSGTAGFMYSNAEYDWSVAAQYRYNGEGYADAEREARIKEARSNETDITQKLSAAGQPSSAYSAFLKGLMYDSGRHYAALNLSKSELFTKNLSASVFAIANLSDFSGFATPSIAYKLFDKTSLSISATFVFGGADAEYVVLNEGTALTLGFKASLGSGSF